ncbi:MAG: flagellar export chaperone FliS [candidate division Zixibacteria bacterium CG_4_9_14_3_um_filter_46_8]|nr:MAG: flagellar export chaperone FliS [candidate division Zixibacteria bacterium CG_4_9_14_3_um_filter_46_8]
MNQNIKTYERVQTDGLNQKQLILILYNGVSRLLVEAKEAIAKKDDQLAHDKLDRARKVVFHLLSTLNFEAGEIAHMLSPLYSFIIVKITEANMKKDADLVDEIIPIVENIKEGWEGIQLDDKTILPENRRIIGNSSQVCITV